MVVRKYVLETDVKGSNHEPAQKCGRDNFSGLDLCPYPLSI